MLTSGCVELRGEDHLALAKKVHQRLPRNLKWWRRAKQTLRKSLYH